VAEVSLQNPALCLCSWVQGELEFFAMGNEKGEVKAPSIPKSRLFDHQDICIAPPNLEN